MLCLLVTVCYCLPQPLLSPIPKFSWIWWLISSAPTLVWLELDDLLVRLQNQIGVWFNICLRSSNSKQEWDLITQSNSKSELEMLWLLPNWTKCTFFISNSNMSWMCHPAGPLQVWARWSFKIENWLLILFMYWFWFGVACASANAKQTKTTKKFTFNFQNWS